MFESVEGCEDILAAEAAISVHVERVEGSFEGFQFYLGRKLSRGGVVVTGCSWHGEL